MSDAVPVVYSAPWCGHCHRLKAQLDRIGLVHRVVDVDEEPEHLDRLAALNGGSWLIPTVELPDGRALVNPSAQQVADAVAGSRPRGGT